MQGKSSKKIIKLAISMLVVMAMLMSSAAMAFAATFQSGSSAIVKVKTTLNFRQGPGTNQKIIARLQNGTKVTVISKTNSWYKVKLSNGKVGYVYSSYLAAASTSGTSTAPVTPVTPVTPTPTPAPSLGALEKDMLAMMFIMVPRAQAAAIRINEVLETEPEIKDPENANNCAADKGYVEFKDVTFSYHEPAMPGKSPSAEQWEAPNAEPGRETGRQPSGDGSESQVKPDLQHV